MNNPIKATKQFVYNTLGNTFDVGGTTVTYYLDPPSNPSTPYVFFNTIQGVEDGVKDTFITDVDFELVIVVPDGFNANSSLLLENIAEHLLGQFATRSSSTLTGWNIISHRLIGVDDDRDEIGQNVFLRKNLQFRFNVEQV